MEGMRYTGGARWIRAPPQARNCSWEMEAGTAKDANSARSQTGTLGVTWTGQGTYATTFLFLEIWSSRVATSCGFTMVTS